MSPIQHSGRRLLWSHNSRKYSLHKATRLKGGQSSIPACETISRMSSGPSWNLINIKSPSSVRVRELWDTRVMFVFAAPRTVFHPRLIEGQLWVIVSHNPLTKWLQRGSSRWVLNFTEAATRSNSPPSYLEDVFTPVDSFGPDREKERYIVAFWCWSGLFLLFSNKLTLIGQFLWLSSCIISRKSNSALQSFDADIYVFLCHKVLMKK